MYLLGTIKALFVVHVGPQDNACMLSPWNAANLRVKASNLLHLVPRRRTETVCGPLVVQARQDSQKHVQECKLPSESSTVLPVWTACRPRIEICERCARCKTPLTV